MRRRLAAVVLLACSASAQASIVVVENTSQGDVPPSCGTPGLVRTFDVAPSFPIHSLTFGLDVYYVYRNYLRARLISPQGGDIELLGQQGGERITFDVMLDSRSQNPLDDGDHDDFNAPFYDRVARPVTNLAAFHGEDASGTWRLQVCATNGTGTFYRARLELRSADIFVDGFESSDSSAWSETVP